MPSTFLQIIQTACDELGLNRPNVAINSTDIQIRQLCALMNRDLREIQQDKDFTALQNEYDLHVAQPIIATGDVNEGLYTITNIQIISGVTDFSSDFNRDFGPNLTGIGNASLWVVNGQNIPVATRLTNVISNTELTMDQPATGTATGIELTIAQDTYPEPVDFDRFINQTWWDRTNRWALLGPDSPQVDQWHRSGVVTIGPRRHFRQIGYNGLTQQPGPVNCYRLWPPPGTTDTPLDLVFEYVSTYMVLASDGTPKTKFTADTDFPILDENMFILGAKWRMWQIKGFDYTSMQAEYTDYVNRRYANDGGAKTLSLPSIRANFLLNPGQVPDGNWPGPGISGA
jgi:hypothetical protein